MISLTDVAEQKIVQNIQRRGSGVGIRVGVKTTGCSGLAYVLEFVDQPRSDDHSIPCGPYAVYVDPKSAAYLQGLTIDYQRHGLNEGFEFVNPNAKDYCGCGESFTV